MEKFFEGKLRNYEEISREILWKIQKLLKFKEQIRREQNFQEEILENEVLPSESAWNAPPFASGNFLEFETRIFGSMKNVHTEKARGDLVWLPDQLK